MFSYPQAVYSLVTFFTMRVLHVISSTQVIHGGTSFFFADLISALSNFSYLSLSVVSQAKLNTSSAYAPLPNVTHFIPATNSNILYSSNLLSILAFFRLLLTSKPDIIHCHGIWSPLINTVIFFAHLLHIPIVLHPHGMLEPWSLARHSRRKQFLLSLFQRRCLCFVDLFMATSHQERLSLLRLGFKAPIAVIPIGFNNLKTSLHRPSISPRKLLFLSRIHPKKGLHMLLRSWSQISAPNWILQVAGPDAGDLTSSLALVSELSIHERVQFLGNLDASSKSAAYGQASLFVLPSYSENFGIVVLEALSHGLPVIVTDTTPWHDVQTYSCGWSIPPTEDSLATTLRHALSLPSSTLTIMGARSKSFASHFTWDKIIPKYILAYNWLLSSGPTPDFIYTA